MVYDENCPIIVPSVVLSPPFSTGFHYSFTTTGGLAAIAAAPPANLLVALPGFCIRLANARMQKVGSAESSK